MSRRCVRFVAATGAAALVLSAQAMAGQARLTISSGKTKNVTCASGVCAPTAKNAVLNVGDLKTMLASGDVEVTTTGSDVQADNIEVRASIDWKSTHTLTLDAYDSIAIAEPVSLKGAGGLDLVTDDGGSSGALSFAKKGHVTFKKLTSSLVINGAAYTLVSNIATLASDIYANSYGNYALANNYDASGDGTYTQSPIATTFSGIFEGLGNKISNLTVDVTTVENGVGLFADAEYIVRDIGLENVSITADFVGQVIVGALVGGPGGVYVENAYATGTVTGTGGENVIVGGLVSIGFVLNSHAAVSVSATETNASGVGATAGGLLGDGELVENSYATGAVTASAANGVADAGGLMGYSYDTVISNSYATGNVSAATSDYQNFAESGGLIGFNEAEITSSYATGAVYASGGMKNGVPSSAGGLIGYEYSGTTSDGYWDTTTSGTDTGVGYGNSSGVTGLTTEQFQSGLPTGFDKTVWREKPKINGGLPYLIAIPPAR